MSFDTHLATPVSVPPRRSPVQLAAITTGAVFLLVGVYGFVPGATSHCSHLALLRHSDTTLLNVSNAVHLGFGAAGIAMASTVARARAYLIGGALTYLLWFLFCSAIDREGSMRVGPVTSIDFWLHVGLANGMTMLGATLGRPRTPRRVRR